MTSRDRFGADRSDGAAWINVLAGIWLILSPWIFGLAANNGRAAWNSIVIGIIIAALAITRVAGGARAAELGWINAVLGGWMIVSPFVYEYTVDPPASTNSIVVGIIVLVVALASVPGTWAGYEYPSMWGGTYPSSWLYPPYGPAGWNYSSYGWAPAHDRNFRGRGPRNYQRSDAQIRDAICERMAEHPGLDASDIDVAVAADGW